MLQFWKDFTPPGQCLVIKFFRSDQENLAILGKDVILVPLPNSHQELNASALAEAGAITLLNQQELAENGSQWWSKFWSTYQPGITGQRMQSYWPPQGTTVFASLIRQQGLRVS